jgi:membrane-bound serine protease (ClpP class)
MFKIVARLGCGILFLVLAATGVAQAAESRAFGGSKRVAVIPIQGEINYATEYALRRRIARALDDKAEVIILEIDSPGGRVDVCKEMCRVMHDVSRKNPGIRTAAFVSKRAISAAAIISLSCDEIYMANGTTFGDAQIITITPTQGVDTELPEKIVSPWRADVRGFAEEKGYPVAVCLGMVDPNGEVTKFTLTVPGDIAKKARPELDLDAFRYADAEGRPNRVAYVIRLHQQTTGGMPPWANQIVDILQNKAKSTEAPESILPTVKKDAEKKEMILSQIIVKKGEILTMTPSQAIEYHISSGTFPDIDTLVSKYGGSSYKRYEKTWSEQLVQFTNSIGVTMILLIAGLVSLYLAVKTPGLGIPEVAAIVIFAIYFFSKYLVGLAGAMEVVLFVAGVTLLLLEVFVIPGFGVAGVSGILCVLLSLVLALMRLDLPWPILYQDAVNSTLLVMLSIVISLLCFTVLLHYLPRSTLFKPLILQNAEVAGAGYVVASADMRGLLGHRGVALTTLRPSGTAEIDGEPHSVIADGEFIDAGQSVIVDEVRGNRIVVRRT